MALNLDILDSYRQDMVRQALKDKDPLHLGTAILEVERFTKELTENDVDKAIDFAEILLELEIVKWQVENLPTNCLTLRGEYIL